MCRHFGSNFESFGAHLKKKINTNSLENEVRDSLEFNLQQWLLGETNFFCENVIFCNPFAD